MRLSARSPRLIVLGVLAMFAGLSAATLGDAGAADRPCQPAVAEGFREVRRVALAPTARFTDTVPYSIDRTAEVGHARRVAYCLELDGRWILTAFDTASDDASLVGVPISTEQVDRRRVAVDVWSNDPSVTTGRGLVGGVEFWPNSYSRTAALARPGGVGDAYDVDDTPMGGRYGSMQVHLLDDVGQEASTLWAVNRFTRTAADPIDVGIGAPAGGQSDWTFANNADEHQLRRLRVYVLDETAEVTDPGALLDGGIVPRRPGGNNGLTTVRGVAPGAASVEATTYDANGDTVEVRTSTPIADGVFRLTVRVPAELESHRVTIETVSADGDRTTIKQVSGLAGGDVIVIQGQSNSVARIFDGIGLGRLETPWVRSFGSATIDAAIAADTDLLTWTTAEADTYYELGTVGTWGMQLGHDLVEANGVPVAIVNGGHGGRQAWFFQRDDADRLNLDTNYGRWFQRMEAAGLDHGFVTAYWYQGESDMADPAGHRENVEWLYDDWRADLRRLTTITLIQVHNGCRAQTPTDDLPVREIQRQVAADADDVLLHSTAALPGHDGCHYTTEGYSVLGSELAQRWQVEQLGVDLGDGVTTPLPRRVTFADATRRSVEIRTDQPTDTPTLGVLTDFSVSGTRVTGADAIPGAIVLHLDRRAAVDATVTYLGVALPATTSSVGLGLPAFADLPIEPAITECTWNDGVLDWPTRVGVEEFHVRLDGRWLADTAGLSWPADRATGHVIRSRADGTTVDLDCGGDVAVAACTAADGVVSWDPVPGEDTYQVRRDGNWVATTNATEWRGDTNGEFVIRHRLGGVQFDIPCTG